MALQETEDKLLRLQSAICVMIEYQAQVPEKMLEDLKALNEQRHKEAQEEIRQLHEEMERMKEESRLADEKFKEQIRKIEQEHEDFMKQYRTKSK